MFICCLIVSYLYIHYALYAMGDTIVMLDVWNANKRRNNRKKFMPTIKIHFEQIWSWKSVLFLSLLTCFLFVSILYFWLPVVVYKAAAYARNNSMGNNQNKITIFIEYLKRVITHCLHAIHFTTISTLGWHTINFHISDRKSTNAAFSHSLFRCPLCLKLFHQSETKSHVGPLST